MTESHDDNSAMLIEQYLDGMLEPAAHVAFEQRIATDASLAAQIDLQRRIDGSLVCTFAPTMADPKIANRILGRLPATGAAEVRPSVPSMRLVGSIEDGTDARSAKPNAAKSNPWKINRFVRGPLAVAAAITLCVGVPFLVMQWKSQFGGRVDHTTVAMLHSMPLDELYQKQQAKGFDPDWVCTPDEFSGYFQGRLGQPLKFTKVPANASKWGVSYAGGLTARSISVVAILDGQEYLVCIDRVESDNPPKFAPDSQLHVHRRVIGDLVLYEVSKQDQPKLLDLFYLPK